MALACGLIFGGEAVQAGQALQWGSPSAPASALSRQEKQSTADVIHDSQVIAAAWDEADSAIETEQVRGPIFVAERHSVVVKRRNQFELDNTEADETDLSNERFAQLPDDPFDDPTIEDYQAPLEEKVEESLPADSSGESQYDLFNAPEDLFEQPADSTDSLEAALPESREEFSQDSDEQGNVDSENIDLWMTPQEITPTEETAFPSSSDSEAADIFEKLTQEDTESADFAQRYDYQADELEREIIDDDPNDWLDYELLLPDVEQLTEEDRKKLEAERAENEDSCKEELEKVRAQKVENIDINIRVEGSAGKDYPFECNLGDERPEPRDWPQITYMWKASGLCHKPLYFEQVHLERYGHSWGPIAQPLLSGVHFFGTLPILPYKMGLKTPNECVYPLGYYRPGNCAPYMIDAFPFTWRAAGYQAGFATGMSFLLP